MPPVVDCTNKPTRKFDGVSVFGGALSGFGAAAIAFFWNQTLPRPKV